MKKLLLAVSVSSLFATSAMAADLHKNCTDYFAYLESSSDLTADAKKQLIDTVKPQFSALPADTQAEACKQALNDAKSSDKDDEKAEAEEDAESK
ncbi:TonB-dependent receptor [Glaesserella sp.]|uniref:TonB-dependent receptor n=1 Tax=Glaesserella sp. TaxID=2094731 RepID=UPI00359F45AD